MRAVRHHVFHHSFDCAAHDKHLKQGNDIPKMPVIVRQNNAVPAVSQIRLVGKAQETHDRCYITNTKKQIRNQQANRLVFQEPCGVLIFLIVMNAQRIYHTGNRHIQRHMKRIDDIGQMIESVAGIVWNDHAGSRIHSGCMRQNDQKSRRKFYCIVMV